jgi:hypothetical protein
MLKKISVLALSFLGCAALQAQEVDRPVKLGLKVGVPITDMFSASNTDLFGNTTTPGNYTSGVPKYTFGVSGEFRLPYHLRFEVDGLYKRAGFTSYTSFGSAGFGYRPTSLNVWEIPGLFKYNVSMGHLRPFVDFGASLRHISTINQTTYLPGVGYGVISNNAIELRNRNSFGGVAGFGITFKKGPFELTPEARYTRWANQSFTAEGLRTNLDQGDVLLGISF